MIPGSNVLKALNYKDINAEFVKHSRAASMTAATAGAMVNLNVEIPMNRIWMIFPTRLTAPPEMSQ